MNQGFDTILFDLDGTLTDPGQGITRSLQHALARLGMVPPQASDLFSYIGPPLGATLMERMNMDEPTAKRATALFREYYEPHGWQENKLYNGIPELLAALKAAGKTVMLATNKPQPMAEKILHHFNIAQYFDEIVGSGLDGTRGNKTLVIQEALHRAKDGASAVMAGDTKYDVEGAQNNGIPCIGLTYGYGPQHELEGAIAIAHSPAQLGMILLAKQKLGRFIVFEGGDGSGKTTQIDLLKNALAQRGEEVLLTREPGSTPISEAVRHIVLSPEYMGMDAVCEANLYAAARAQHVRRIIKPALLEGKTVLCDRYIHSSLAYQGAGRGLGEDAVLDINRAAMDGLWPDTVLLLDMDPEQALARAGKDKPLDRLELEKADFRQRIQTAYRDMAQKNPALIHCIDAGQDAQTVHQSILQALALD